MGLVRFVTTTGPGYNGITSKDKDTLYFISDERRIYKGEVPYSGGIFTTVAEFPETGEVNTLYVNSATGEVRYYNGTSYQTVVPATGKSITGNGDGSLATTAAVAAYVTSQPNSIQTQLNGFDGRISANATAIDAEKTRAKGAEQTLQNGINTNATKITANKNDITAINASFTKKFNATEKSALLTKINANTNSISDITATITNSNGAVPIFVNSVSDMKDTGRVYILTTDSHIYTYVNGAWKDSGVQYASNNADKLGVYSYLIQASNYASFLPNADSALDNNMYILNFAGNSESIPSNLPFSKYPTGEGTLSTLATYKPANENKIRIQRWSNRTQTWERYTDNTGAWSDWHAISSDDTIYVNNLEDLLNALDKYENKTIYVNSGTYDFVKTLGSFFDKWNTSLKHFDGFDVKNTLICSPNAKFVCNYTGNNATLQQMFSPFKLSSKSCKIVGMHLVVSGVRYCIHDETAGKDEPYVHEYENCYLENNNTASQSGYVQCIGGGLGTASNIIIKNCEFKSSLAQNKAYGIVSYHNSYKNYGRSFISISNSFFHGKGTVKGGWYGTSTSISKILVSGCHLGSNIINIPETAESAQENLKVYSWNNDVSVID